MPNSGLWSFCTAMSLPTRIDEISHRRTPHLAVLSPPVNSSSPQLSMLLMHKRRAVHLASDTLLDLIDKHRFEESLVR